MPHGLALRTATLLIALAGVTAGTARADVKKDPPLSAVETSKMLAFFDELVDHIVKSSAEASCPSLAEAVDGVVTRHLNTLEMMWAAKKANKTVPPEVQAKMDKRALEMVRGIRRCLDDDKVKEAFKRMKPPKEKDPKK